jgi:hypothetical protein
VRAKMAVVRSVYCIFVVWNLKLFVFCGDDVRIFVHIYPSLILG